MKTIQGLVQRAFAYFIDRGGVSTVEYALILVAVIAIVAGGAVLMEDSFTELFTDLGAQIEDVQEDLKKL